MNILRRILTRFRNPWRPTTEPPRYFGWYDLRTPRGDALRAVYHGRQWVLWSSGGPSGEVIPGEGWEWRKP